MHHMEVHMDPAARFRNAVNRRSGAGPRRGRYPDDAKPLALEHLALVVDAGGTAVEPAKPLGIDVNTLRGWQQRAKPPAVRSNCVFRRSRSGVPAEADQLFRTKSITRSVATLSFFSST